MPINEDKYDSIVDLARAPKTPARSDRSAAERSDQHSTISFKIFAPTEIHTHDTTSRNMKQNVLETAQTALALVAGIEPPYSDFPPKQRHADAMIPHDQAETSCT
jgi:hypothetical protein